MWKLVLAAIFCVVVTVTVNLTRSTVFLHGMKMQQMRHSDIPISLLEASNVEERTEIDESHKNHNKLHKPMNIILFYPDDWRHDSIGAENSIVKTPCIDKLAREGMRFTHNCVTTSVCWVSRATLFTGQYLSRHRSEQLSTPRFCQKKKWENTWPYLLKKAGYYIGHVGKWQYHNHDFVHQKYADWSKVFDGQHWVDWSNGSPDPEHVIDVTEREAMTFLKQRPKEKLFALTVAFYPPKAEDNLEENKYFPKNEDMYQNETIPEPPDMYTGYKKLPHFFDATNEARMRFEARFGTPEKYQASMKKYYALITEVDTSMKNILENVEKEGILNNTLVIFTTDNGYFHAEHGLAGKWYPYQESIRVPLVIKDPRMPANMRGKLNNDFTLNIDLASTILGAANLASPQAMQGRDIAELYAYPEDERKPWRKEFYYEHHLSQFGSSQIPMSSALVRKKYKYVRFPQFKTEQLFDLVNDPLEQQNIVKENSTKMVLAEMRLRYKALKKSAK